ncbi:molecular chaperone DnaJ [Rhodoblastus sphagnicola]|uniref:Molecular chaperone DnaJ n=1 Tax=Rhodoblastus sphagnicola TaxID=333368 RepID=A0A2S6N573_9HYPH|nr:DnaJ C-terminal domain-containing protein [Rhodoblastus sphagnicola]MBB4197130.1 DnaJ-class molecular chaperone [Rhodoblastus sphagnicola]PPQ29749.1 molecular chaperone DnaJ [Rhodoblastus sphagnicola]
MRDPYQILGVAKDASQADVKKAFRKLAKQHHPDQNPNEPKAKDKFAEVNSAYEILGDEKKRGAFDRGEIDAEGKPRGFEGFPGGGFRRGGHGGGPGGGAGPGAHPFEFNFGGGSPFDAADIFSDLFGRGGPGAARGAGAGPGARARQPGADIALDTHVSLETALHGGKARVQTPSGKTLEINVPAGVEEGKQIRLRGQGQPSPGGGPAGDALVTVHIQKHPHFRVDGRDIRLDLPVTLYEAVLGGRVEAPTLGGKVELTLPPKSNSGKTLRLRGKGLPAAGGQPAGDLLITLRITLPDGGWAELEEVARKMQAKQPYDPRVELAK